MVFNAIEVLSQSDLAVKKDLVERIVASSSLRKSARLRDLFLYLCSRTLDQGVQDIHELEVGHRVFGRPEQYDTTADNIVRVHASTLRKRLNQYFDKDGRNESFVIEIPKGNYAPLFIERSLACEPQEKSDSASTNLPSLPLPLEPKEETAGQPATVSRFSGRLLWALGSASLLAVFFCGLSIYLFVHGPPQSRAQQPAVTDQPTVRQFWSGVFPMSGSAEVVLDDAPLDFYQNLINHPVAVAEYYDRSYLASVEKNASNSKIDPARVYSLMLSRQSSFAYSAVVWRMAQIAGELHRPANLQFARDLTFRQVKGGNVVLLGNSQSNPWIQLFESRISIAWVPDPVLHTYYPQDKAAPDSVRDQFRASESDGNGRAGYASISFLPNLSGSGNALILTATGGSAMGMAVDFLTSETAIRQLLSRLPKSPTATFPYFDLLLKTDRGTRELNSVRVLICRPPGSQSSHQ